MLKRLRGESENVDLMRAVEVSRIKATATRFSRRVDGTAAMEFALLVPFMIYMFLCATDIARALTISRRLTNAADTVAELVSQVSTTGSSGALNTPSGTVTDTQLKQAFNSIQTTFPDILTDASTKHTLWQYLIQPIASSVIFSNAGTPSACSATTGSASVCDTATVVWSAGYAYGALGPNGSVLGAAHRTCTTLTKVANSVNPSLTTLPAGLYGGYSATPPGTGYPGTLIVVDLTYSFSPLFSAWITGPITFHRAAYLAPRFFTQLTRSTSNPQSDIISCP